MTTVTQHKVTTFKVSREWTDAIFDEIDQDRNGEVSERELKLLLRAGRPDPNASFRKTSRIVRASLMIGGSGGTTTGAMQVAHFGPPERAGRSEP